MGCLKVVEGIHASPRESDACRRRLKHKREGWLERLPLPSLLMGPSVSWDANPWLPTLLLLLFAPLDTPVIP